MVTFNADKKRLTRITTSPRVTPYLREEIEALGFEVQSEDHAGVHIGATFEDCMKLNLQLRTGLHVMWLLKKFRCPSPKALYTHAASFPWEELISNDAYFSISSNVDNPKVNNSMYPNLVLKDAIADRMTKQTGARPDSGSDRSHIVINLYWRGDQAWIYLNTTGRRLADRGYRRMPHSAPMQETLAAAVVMATGYDGTAPLVNPMCGAGTIAIEAALLALNRAPGLFRTNYSFTHTKLHNEDMWRTLRIAAKKQTLSNHKPIIIASDHDPVALHAARKNAQTAGVEQVIEFVQCDFEETPMPQDNPGIVILNPEYGERLGALRDLEETYKRIGSYFKNHCAGWVGCVFTGNRELSHQIGLRTCKRVPFMNARIDCRLLMYDMYKGTRQSDSIESKDVTSED